MVSTEMQLVSPATLTGNAEGESEMLGRRLRAQTEGICCRFFVHTMSGMTTYTYSCRRSFTGPTIMTARPCNDCGRKQIDSLPTGKQLGSGFNATLLTLLPSESARTLISRRVENSMLLPPLLLLSLAYLILSQYSPVVQAIPSP
jgi:hypothetical protein